jgi:hypothetical protein
VTLLAASERRNGDLMSQIGDVVTARDSAEASAELLKGQIASLKARLAQGTTPAKVANGQDKGGVAAVVRSIRWIWINFFVSVALFSVLLLMLVTGPARFFGGVSRPIPYIY